MQSRINNYFIPRKRKFTAYTYKQTTEKVPRTNDSTNTVKLKSVFECFNLINPLINPKDMSVSVLPSSKVLECLY